MHVTVTLWVQISWKDKRETDKRRSGMKGGGKEKERVGEAERERICIT